MLEPRPHGLTSIGDALTDGDTAAVELLARRLTHLKMLSGVESLRMVCALPDGGYVIAQDVAGVFRVITHKPEPLRPAPPFDGIATDYIPMLFSGVVTDATPLNNGGVGLKFTEQCRRRLAHYDPDNLPEKSAALQRFRVGYHAQVSELAPQAESVRFYSQYVALRPTWYSGAMAEVVQIVGGYGRQRLPELPDTPIERARLLIPPAVQREIAEQIGNSRLPGYTGFPDTTGQIQYDYKFHNTNVVSFDAGNRPWLLRIGNDGVWAMPLPLIPATTTTAFRTYMEDVGDTEIIAILDRFGGMPSGEGFPGAGSAFQAWRRAGVVIKVCDIADFYSHISYSSACGWSVNTRGTEGYNCCYDYDEAEGLAFGLGYKLSLSLGVAVADGKLAPLRFDDSGAAPRLNQYLSSLYQLLSDDQPAHLAIKYKLRRVETDRILERAGLSAIDAREVDFWDGLELPPIAQHAGSVAQVARGWLYHGAKFANQPQLKFPEPLLGGCISHDFLPLLNGRGKSKYPKCDTVMFGYYAGDQLKVVRYFREDRTYLRDVEDNYDQCMTVGSWTRTATTGATSLEGNFYTSDLDERKALAPTVEVTQIVGKDLGYDRKPNFQFDDFFSRPGTLWRNRYYSHTTNIETSEGHALAVAVCIPYLCRNAVLYASRESTTGSRRTESAALKYITDPTTYRYWTQDFVFAWTGSLPVMKGKPTPINGAPVWVEIEEYNPSLCSDFADQGPWIPQLPADYTWLIHPNRNEWLHSGGGGAPAFKPYSTSTTAPATEKAALSFCWSDASVLVHGHPDALYFLGSPDDVVGVFYRDASAVVFGDAVYSNASETVGGRRAHWGYSSLADHQSAHHFVGVIHE